MVTPLINEQIPKDVLLLYNEATAPPRQPVGLFVERIPPEPIIGRLIGRNISENRQVLIDLLEIMGIKLRNHSDTIIRNWNGAVVHSMPEPGFIIEKIHNPELIELSKKKLN